MDDLTKLIIDSIKKNSPRIVKELEEENKRFEAAIEHSKRIVNSKGDGEKVKYPGRSMNNPFKGKEQ